MEFLSFIRQTPYALCKLVLCNQFDLQLTTNLTSLSVQQGNNLIIIMVFYDSHLVKSVKQRGKMKTTPESKSHHL